MPSSLSADTKDALARDMPEALHCREALLHALALYGADRHGSFVTQRNAVARLFRSLFTTEIPHIIMRSSKRLTGAPSYAIEIPERLRAVPAKPMLKCDRLMEVRAAFLACGSLSGGAHGYHLEFFVNSADTADRLAFMLRSLGREPKRMTRGRHIVLYFKDFDAIAEVLTTIGAHNAVLQLEDIRALRETKNRIHRLVNTEAANVDRSVEAGAAQQRTIRYLESAYGLQNLTPPLREIAELRLAHPESSLAELGRRCNPAIGKPTVNSRLNALAQLAKRLQGSRPGGAKK